MDPSTATNIAIFVFIVITIIVTIILTVSVPVSVPISAPAATAPTGPQYLGCFKDDGNRVLKAGIGLKTLAQCASAAKAAGSKYFGLQYRQVGDGKTTAQCFHGSDAYNRLGTDTGCTNVGYPYQVGGSWSNAVYSV